MAGLSRTAMVAAVFAVSILLVASGYLGYWFGYSFGYENGISNGMKRSWSGTETVVGGGFSCEVLNQCGYYSDSFTGGGNFSFSIDDRGRVTGRGTFNLLIEVIWKERGQATPCDREVNGTGTQILTGTLNGSILNMRLNETIQYDHAKYPFTLCIVNFFGPTIDTTPIRLQLLPGATTRENGWAEIEYTLD